jgi:hypothetical protein
MKNPPFKSAEYCPWDADSGFSQDAYWTWCPSIIQAGDGTWRMFASRWPIEVPFHPGWLVHSEVILAEADCAIGPYRFREVLLPQRGAEWWDGRMTHNSRIVSLPDGGYALFYTGTTFPFPNQSDAALTLSDPRVICARAGKRIGVAIAPSLEGPWERLPAPVLPTRPDSFYSFLTSNAAPWIEADGSVLLVFKARAYEGNSHGPMVLGAARASNVRGPYEVLGEIRFDTQVPYELEDPFLWKQDDLYHLVAKDMTGSLCGEARAGVHAVSSDGIDWQLAEPVKAYSRKVPTKEGSMIEFGSLERVSLVFENGRAAYLSAAVSDGPDGFTSATRSWNTLIPLADHT